jgi:hypothetical protein
MEFISGKPTPYQAAKGDGSNEMGSAKDCNSSFIGSSPIPGVDMDDFSASIQLQNDKEMRKAA